MDSNALKNAATRLALYSLLTETSREGAREAASGALKHQQSYTVRRTVGSKNTVSPPQPTGATKPTSGALERTVPDDAHRVASAKDTLTPTVPIHLRVAAARRVARVVDCKSPGNGVDSPHSGEYGLVELTLKDSGDATLTLHLRDDQELQNADTALKPVTSSLTLSAMDSTRGVYAALYQNLRSWTLHQKALISLGDTVRAVNEALQQLTHDFQTLSGNYERQEELYCGAAARLLNEKKKRIRQLQRELEAALKQKPTTSTTEDMLPNAAQLGTAPCNASPPPPQRHPKKRRRGQEKLSPTREPQAAATRIVAQKPERHPNDGQASGEEANDEPADDGQNDGKEQDPAQDMWEF